MNITVITDDEIKKYAILKRVNNKNREIKKIDQNRDHIPLKGLLGVGFIMIFKDVHVFNVV